MKMNNYRMELIGKYNTQKEANTAFNKEVYKRFNPMKAVKAFCVKCGGEGYAQDDTMFDTHGFLIGAKCPCGGAIHKV